MEVRSFTCGCSSRLNSRFRCGPGLPASARPALRCSGVRQVWTGAVPKEVSADAGYYSATAVDGLYDLGVDPFVAPEKTCHGRVVPPRGRIPSGLSPRDRMRRKLQTKRGRALRPQDGSSGPGVRPDSGPGCPAGRGAKAPPGTTRRCAGPWAAGFSRDKPHVPGQSHSQSCGLPEADKMQVNLVLQEAAMNGGAAGTLSESFSGVDDPRTDRGKRHGLMDIISITICAVICGAEGWADIELFAKCKYDWLKGFLSLSNGVPSHDTFGRVFSRIDPKQFQNCFMEWVKGISELTQGQVIAIDGKTLRRSHDKSSAKAAIHMVSAWATENSLVLGQTKVEAKSNEITAIPHLLKMLEVSGCIVTIDAMGCQKEIAKTIIERGAYYVLSLKKNQPQLHRDVSDTFAYAREDGFSSIAHDFHETVEKNHGRIEKRRCWTTSEPDHLNYMNEGGQWKNLASIGMVEAQRSVNGKTSVETRFYISSLPGDAKVLLAAIRGHWGIENSLHWVLDISFREDESRVRTGNAAENLALIRHMALNLLKQDNTSKASIKGKRKRAGWDSDYLLAVISQ